MRLIVTLAVVCPLIHTLCDSVCARIGARRSQPNAFLMLGEYIELKQKIFGSYQVQCRFSKVVQLSPWEPEATCKTIFFWVIIFSTELLEPFQVFV